MRTSGWRRWSNIFKKVDAHPDRRQLMSSFNAQMAKFDHVPNGEERYNLCSELLEEIMDAMMNPRFSFADAADEYDETIKAQEIMESLK